jgi:hypothetical protein
MTSTRGTAEAKARQAGRQVGRWIEKLARLGYLAKAVVYGLIGILALRLAFGMGGGETTDVQGALQEIAGAPWGKLLLLAIALGLLGYAAWRFVQGVLDVDDAGTDAEGLAKRVGYAGSGVIHAGLALAAFSLATGGGGGDGNGEQAMTARLMANEWGVWLVGLAGLITIVVGVYQFKLGRDARFTRNWNTAEMSPKQRQWGTRAGRFGLMARGVVFVIMGFFLLEAAWKHDASEARGLEGALTELASAGYGTWLLAVVALGFVCYAVYCVVQARYVAAAHRGGRSVNVRSPPIGRQGRRPLREGVVVRPARDPRTSVA